MKLGPDSIYGKDVDVIELRRRMGIAARWRARNELSARHINDRHLPDKPGGDEGVQGVVDGRKRHAHAGASGLGMEAFRRQMAAPLREQDAGQLDALARDPIDLPRGGYRTYLAPAAMLELFDMLLPDGERRSLAAEFPEIVRELQAYLK